VAQTDPNTKVDLGILRNKKQITVSATVAKMKNDDQVASNDDEDDSGGPADTNSAVTVSALGATLAAVTPETRQQFNLDKDVKGVIVADIDSDGPLADQGIRPGDVIERVSDSDVASPEDVKKLADRAKAEKQGVLLMLVDRQGRDLFVAVKLGDA
jgi:serine protease Do